MLLKRALIVFSVSIHLSLSKVRENLLLMKKERLLVVVMILFITTVEFLYYSHKNIPNLFPS